MSAKKLLAVIITMLMIITTIPAQLIIASAEEESVLYHRGVNMSCAESGSYSQSTYGTNYAFVPEKAYKYFNTKNQTIYRVPVLWERLQPTLGGSLDETNLNGLIDSATWAANHGGKIIIDIHNYEKYRDNAISSPNGPTVEQFCNLWIRLSDVFKNNDAVYAYDLMNEPVGSNKTMSWEQISQAAVTAIRNNNDNKLIWVEGNNWSSAANWDSNNNGLGPWINDPANNIAYSAHCYFDREASGAYTHSYDDELAMNPNLANIGVERVTPFINWCDRYGVKGCIGEYGAPNSDSGADFATSQYNTRWLTVVDNFLDVLDEAEMDATMWGAGSWWGGTKLNVYPVDQYNSGDYEVDAVMAQELYAHPTAYGTSTRTYNPPVVYEDGLITSGWTPVQYVQAIDSLSGFSSASRLFDGDTSDAAWSTGTTTWSNLNFTIDLGNTYNITKYKLYGGNQIDGYSDPYRFDVLGEWENGDHVSRRMPTAWNIYYSEDGTNWELLEAVTGNQYSMHEYNFDVEARYIKYEQAGNFGYFCEWGCIRELKLYGTLPGADSDTDSETETETDSETDTIFVPSFDNLITENWTSAQLSSAVISHSGLNDSTNVFDNNVQNGAGSNGTKNYSDINFTIDLGQDYDLEGYRLYSGNYISDYPDPYKYDALGEWENGDHASRRMATSWNIYYSSNGTDWTPLDSASNYEYSLYGKALDTTARYVKFVLADKFGYYCEWGCLRELQLFGTATEADTETETDAGTDTESDTDTDTDAETETDSDTETLVPSFNNLITEGWTSSQLSNAIIASSGLNDYARVFDNNSANSAWSTGTWDFNSINFTIDLGEAYNLEGYRLYSGNYLADNPDPYKFDDLGEWENGDHASRRIATGWNLYYSNDGTTWTLLDNVSNYDYSLYGKALDVSARYIKYELDARFGYYCEWGCLRELELYGTNDSVITENWTSSQLSDAIIASSGLNSAANVFDNDLTSSAWSTGTWNFNSISFTLDLGALYDLSSYALYGGNYLENLEDPYIYTALGEWENGDHASRRMPTAWNIYYSTNGTDWTLLDAVTGNQYSMYTNDVDVAARYIKYEQAGNFGYYCEWGCIRELQLIGSLH